MEDFKKLIDFEHKFSDEDLDEVVREADRDGNGQINYKEFVNLISQLK